MVEDLRAITFTVLRGREAWRELCMTGLLDGQKETAMPLVPQDLQGMLLQSTSVCVIGYIDDVPVGYIAGQVYEAGRSERHLFLHQAWTRGTAQQSRQAAVLIDRIACALGCQAISTTAPPKVAALLERRYGFAPIGIHLLRRVIVHGDQ